MKNYHGIVNDNKSDFNLFKLTFESDFEGYIGTFSYSDKLINSLFTAAQLEESVNIDIAEMYEK